MRKLCTIILLLLPAVLYAQAPNIEWQKTFGGTTLDEGSSIKPTLDGGYIMTGLSTSVDGDVTGNHGATDHWVVKIDADGALEWQQSYGGSADDKGYDIVQTSDGGYVFTGYTASSDGDVTGANNGFTDYWIVKINSTGGIEWQKNYGGTGAENPYTIKQTFDGGYAVFGLSNTSNGSGDVSSGHGTFDFWFCKLDGTGALVWEKTYGSTATEQGFGMQQTADSGYVLCGFSSGSNGDVTSNQGGNDYWIVKIDDIGAIEWQRSYGGSGSDRAYNVIQTADGGYLVNGVSPSTDGDVIGNHGGIDYWVLKLDGDGLLEWQRSLGGSGDDFGRSIQQTLDGGYIVGGKTNTPNDGDVTGNHGDTDYWLVKLDATGTTEWQKCYGGSLGEAASGSTVPFMTITQLPDGKYIMAGATFSTDGDVTGNVSSSATDDNYWVVKLFGCPSYSGSIDTICSNSSVEFNDMVLTASGIYYDTLQSVSNCDSIIKLDLFVRPDPGAAITNTTGVLTTGSFAGYQWLLDGQAVSGATSQMFTPEVNGDYQVAITDQNGCTDTSEVETITGLSVKHLLPENAVSIYPNPARDQINISCPEIAGAVNVSLFSIEGKLILTERITAAKTSLSLQGLADGIYLLKLTTENGQTLVRRVVKN